MSVLSFLRQWTRNPALIGAVAPSSKHLSLAMAQVAGHHAEIIELGAGTGAITESLVLLNPHAKLWVFEPNPELLGLLHRKFPRATLVPHFVHERKDVFENCSEDVVVVSSIPFRSLSVKMIEPTVEVILDFLRKDPSRKLVQFTYQPRAPFDVPDDFKWHRRAFVARNLPPAGVWELSYAPKHLS